MRRTIAVLAALAFLGFAPAGQAADYKDEYKLSAVLPPAFPWGMAAQRWIDLVEERTDGRIEIKRYRTSALLSGAQTREFTALRAGAIDMAVGNTLNWSPQIKQLNVFNLPFLMPDYAAIDAIVDGEAGKRLFDLIEQRGVKPLAWGTNGFRQVSNSVRKVETPSDLEGLKIRVVGSPLYNDTFSALGANPTQMNWGDALSAVGSEAIDGLEVPLIVFKKADLASVGLEHVTLWNYAGGQLIFAVNRDAWNQWSEQDQQIVRRAAVQAAKENRIIARKGMIPPDDHLVEEIRGQDVTVTRLSDEQLEAFKQATRPVYEDWKQRIGPELVDTAEHAVETRYD